MELNSLLILVAFLLNTIWPLSQLIVIHTMFTRLFRVFVKYLNRSLGPNLV